MDDHERYICRLFGVTRFVSKEAGCERTRVSLLLGLYRRLQAVRGGTHRMRSEPLLLDVESLPESSLTGCCRIVGIYEKVIKVKADVAAVRD